MCVRHSATAHSGRHTLYLHHTGSAHIVQFNVTTNYDQRAHAQEGWSSMACRVARRQSECSSFQLNRHVWHLLDQQAAGDDAIIAVHAVAAMNHCTAEAVCL
jgi:hypothetical protein